MDWIYLAQDRDQWRAVVSTVMKFGFYEKRRVFEQQRDYQLFKYSVPSKW
jgi:hypothetical protein